MEAATDRLDLRAIAHSVNASAATRVRARLSWPEYEQVSPGLVNEALWHELMTPVRDRWEARSADEGLTRQQRRYAARRATRLDGAYASRTKGCARSGVMVQCGCQKRAQMFTCGQHLICELCQVKRAKRQRARIRHALLNATEGLDPRRWVAVLVTLTAEHSDDVGDTRRRIVEGWRKFYKALRRRIGGWKYVGVHEVTPGTDELGHPHAHIVVIWPRFDWKRIRDRGKRVMSIHDLWRRCCPSSSSIDLEPARSVRGAAKYLGKYVSKGVNTDDFSPDLRARVLAATYGSRWLFTSVRMWVAFQPLCPCCGQPYLRDIVTRWLASRADDVACDGNPDWWDPGNAGGPQAALPIPEDN